MICLSKHLVSHILIFLDYVYFEAQQQQQSAHHQQQQPFQIRRIEELNKTAGGNVEAKVMCFYRRRDLPAQLIALADKHQQQQLSLTLSLSSSGSNTIKSSGKQVAAIKATPATDKDSVANKKDQDTGTSIVKKEQQVGEEEQAGSKTECAEVNETVKEEQQPPQDVEMAETEENDSATPAIVKSGDTQGDRIDSEANNKSNYIL